MIEEIEQKYGPVPEEDIGGEDVDMLSDEDGSDLGQCFLSLTHLAHRADQSRHGVLP